MVYFFVVFFAVFHIVSTNPVPLSSIDPSLLTNSVDDPALSIDQNTFEIVGCDVYNPTINLADEDIENGQNANIVERDTNFCRPEGFKIPWKYPSKKGPSRVPNPQPTSSPDSSILLTEPGNSDNPCTIATQQVVLSCAGPEIWYQNRVDLVINCVAGKRCCCESFDQTLIW